jgi:CHAT domain-containing protein/tetratricopeptide (TPR) repeat protein
VQSSAFQVVLFLVSIAIGSAQIAVKELLPHSTLQESLAGDAEQIYGLEVPANQQIDLTFREKQGVAGIVVANAEDGSEVVRMDLYLRTPAGKRLLLAAGKYRIRLLPSNHGPLKRLFDIETSDLQADTDAGRLRRSAEQLLGKAESIGQSDSAEVRRKEFGAAVDIWQRLGDKLREADTLFQIGWSRNGSGVPGAMDAYQRAYDLSKAESYKAGIGEALFGFSAVHYTSGEPVKAIKEAEQALEIQRELGDFGGQCETLRFLGQSLQLSHPEQARARFLEGIEAAHRAGDPVTEAGVVNALGRVEFDQGDFINAEVHFSQAYELFRAEEILGGAAARELMNLGALYSARGEYQRAIEYYEQALPALKSLGVPTQHGNILFNMAAIRHRQGELQKAQDELTVALALFRQAKYRYGEANSLRELAAIHDETGNTGKASELLNEALAITRGVSDRRSEAATLNRLADLESKLGHDERALALNREALAINRAAGYKQGEAQTLESIARSLLKTDVNSALESALAAQALEKELKNSYGEATVLDIQARAWTKLGDDVRARSAFEQSLEYWRKSGVRSAEASTLLALARLERDQGHLEAARDRIMPSLEALEWIRANTGGEDARMRLAALHREYYDLAIDVEMQLHDSVKAFELSERAHARSLADLLAEARIDVREGVDPALLASERKIKELLDAKDDRLTRLLESAQKSAQAAILKRELDELVERYRVVETEIRSKSPRYAAVTQPQPASVSEVQAHLTAADTVLIEFWLGEERSFGWIVTKTGCRGFNLPARAVIENLARRTYDALNERNQQRDQSIQQEEGSLKTASQTFVRTSQELSRALLAPAGKALQVRRLWIVSDGALAYVPFSALPQPASTTPLVATHEVSMLPSASVLLALSRPLEGRPPADATVAVFADPVFTANDERLGGHVAEVSGGTDVTRAAGEAGLTSLPRLHFSREEADAIAALAPARQVWKELNFDASRENVKNPELARYRVIHFATHGLLNSRHPELSGLVLSMVDKNGRPQDGFLRLHEIYDLKLNADLVVLSGCQTALGKEIRSEGLIGLTRGFMYAGSPQVVASLWGVRDRATAEFMRRFYEALLGRHLAPAAALRETQLSMLRDERWKDPYYWAAFTVQGVR